jgi:hypothetical protein
MTSALVAVNMKGEVTATLMRMRIPPMTTMSSNMPSIRISLRAVRW